MVITLVVKIVSNKKNANVINLFLGVITYYIDYTINFLLKVKLYCYYPNNVRKNTQKIFFCLFMGIIDVSFYLLLMH